MLRYSFKMETAAQAIEMSIERVLKRGVHTAELPGRGRPVTSTKMGDLIAETTRKVLTFLNNSNARPKSKAKGRR